MNRLIIKIAKALLVARWRQTLVAAIGVTFSIMMFVTLLGFMNGLNKMLDNLILNRTPHVRLYKELKASKVQPVQHYDSFRAAHNFIRSIKPKQQALQVRNSMAIIEDLRKDARVLGVAPKVNTSVFYNVGATNLPGNISGVEVDEEMRLLHLSEYITTGNPEDLKNVSNSIILGKGAADMMLAEIGDVIQITSATGQIMQLKVVGFYQSGIADVDKVQSITSLSTAQKIMGETENYVTDIQVKLHDILQAPVLSKEFALKYDVDAIDIQTANAQFETGTSVRNLISYVVGIVLLIVSGFGIYNILNMMIYEKMDSIAIMKATGFSGRDVKRVFLSIALSLGVFGGAAGLLLGLLTTFLISRIPFNTEALPMIKFYPVSYNYLFYVIAGAFSIITTYLAGYFPSRKASKVDPVVIIRGK